MVGDMRYQKALQRMRETHWGWPGAYKLNALRAVLEPEYVARDQRTLTERVAKRIRRGKAWGKSVPDSLIVEWAEQYAICRSFHAYVATTPHSKVL